MTEPDWGECDIGGEEEEEADEGKEGDDQGGQVQAWKYKHEVMEGLDKGRLRIFWSRLFNWNMHSWVDLCEIWSNINVWLIRLVVRYRPQ